MYICGVCVHAEETHASAHFVQETPPKTITIGAYKFSEPKQRARACVFIIYRTKGLVECYKYLYVYVLFLYIVRLLKCTVQKGGNAFLLSA